VKKPVENNDCPPEPKFKPAIGFHGLKYNPGDRATAMRRSTHAGLYDSSPASVSKPEEP
jgi:hypothetical protein